MCNYLIFTMSIFFTAYKPEIKSVENIDTNYLRAEIYSNKKKCGFIDFIEGKVNINISYKSNGFKGLLFLKESEFSFNDNKLTIISNKKRLLNFICNPQSFELIELHIHKYNSYDQDKKKDDFFSNK